MGVYIKDMEMPKRCLHCPLVRDGYFPPKCAFPRRRKVTEHDTPQSNPACYLTEERGEDNTIKIPENEFRIYSRAMLVALILRDLLVNLNSFAEVPKSIEPVANAPVGNEKDWIERKWCREKARWLYLSPKYALCTKKRRTSMEALEFLREAQRMCGTKHCVECPIGKYINHSEDKLEEIVSEVEQWSKEHPLVTNKMKIREVFGGEAIYAISSPNVQALKDWLDEPYKEPEHDL